MISNYAVGVDNVDVAAATARGIPVGHTPDVLTDSTADLAVALMLAIARRLPEGERIVRAGEWGTWDPASFLGRDLHGADGRDRRRRADRDARSPAGSRGSAASCSFAGRDDRAALERRSPRPTSSPSTPRSPTRPAA